MGQTGVLRACFATRPAEVWVLLRRARADSIRARKSTDFRYKPNICPQLTHTVSYSVIPLQWGVVHICRKAYELYHLLKRARKKCTTSAKNSGREIRKKLREKNRRGTAFYRQAVSAARKSSAHVVAVV